MSVVSGPLPPASATRRGTMSAADKEKLDLYPADPDDLGGGVVEAVTDGNGLTLTTGTLAMGAAGASDAGAVTTGAQTFAGAKTLSGAVLQGITTIVEAVTSLVRATGATLVLRSSAGALSTDVAVRVGTEVSDAGTHASAVLEEVGTGLGGTFVRSFAFLKGGILQGQSAATLRMNGTVGAILEFGTPRVAMTGTTAELRAGSGTATVFSFAANNCARSGSANPGTAATTRLHVFSDAMGSTAVDKACVTSAGEFESLISGAGIVLKSPNGTRWRITVDNTGALAVAAA